MTYLTDFSTYYALMQDAEMLSLVCALVAVLAALLGIGLATAGLRRTGTLARPARTDATEEAAPLTGPKLSVLVHGVSDPDSILAYLAELERQTYTDRETILIYEGTAEAARSLSERVAARFSGVRLTFMPPGSHNLSRRKMALTLGMKAATGDVVLTTASNCIIPSDQWLADMMRPFSEKPGCDIVLGYSHIDFSEMTGPGRWFRQFDALVTSSAWIGAALAGHPYRGDGYNLAFRRHLFFEHNGYARSAYLHYGDDDLFVSEIATPENTVLVITPQTCLTTVWGTAANRIWTDRKERYSFTQRWLRKTPFLLNALLGWSNWGALLGAAGAIALGIWTLPDSFPVGALLAIVVLCVFWNLEIMVYRRAASALGAVRLWWGVVPFMLWRPLANLIFRLRHRSHRFANYTWQRHRPSYIVDYFTQRLRRARRARLRRRG